MLALLLYAVGAIGTARLAFPRECYAGHRRCLWGAFLVCISWPVAIWFIEPEGGPF